MSDECSERVDELEDYVDLIAEDVFGVEDTVDDVDDAVADLTATVETLASRVSELESRQATGRTSRAAREDELQDAMIRLALSRGGPVSKWWRELKDLAATLDLDESDYSKAVWDRHIESLQDEPGFAKTAKLAQMEHRDERRQVKAITVNPEDVPPSHIEDATQDRDVSLPESPVRDNGNDVTTDVGSQAPQSTDQPLQQQSDD